MHRSYSHASFLHAIVDAVGVACLSERGGHIGPDSLEDYATLAVMAAMATIRESALKAALDRIKSHTEETCNEFIEKVGDIAKIPQVDLVNETKAIDNKGLLPVEPAKGTYSTESVHTSSIGTDLSDDDLMREILKLALSNEKAWVALRRVFLEHRHPEHLDRLGQRIRSTLLLLDKESHGKD